MASTVLAKMAVELSANAAGLVKGLGSAEKSLKGFSSTVSKVATAATLGFATISFAAIARDVVNITAEFQKFEAVLTNTLGSKSESQEALKLIQNFAAKTPFSVQELTASFVKLANQGFKPTGEEMRKLGDLASSTGKTFDQLTEAVIDAQAGEFERLKEFGIRAQKQGDQVKFTFKGVATETKFTSDAINEYILSLGNLEGVSGSMAAISGTLGGSISNLGDSFDKLLLRVGNLTSGPLKFFIDQAQLAMNTLAGDIAGETGETTILSKIVDEFVDGAKTAEEMAANVEKLKGFLKLTTEESANLATKTATTSEEIQKLEKDFSSAKEFTAAYGTAIELLTKKMGGLKDEVEKVPNLSLIQEINKEIANFEKKKAASFSTEEIGRFNVKLQELRDQLEFINSTGSESGFLKNLNKGIAGVKLPETQAPENLFPVTIPLDTDPWIQGLKEMDQASADFHVNEETRKAQAMATNDAYIQKQKDLELKQQEINATAEQFGQVVGDAFGRAAAGQITFKQALKQTTGEILKLFLQRALAGVVAGAAGTTAPPPVILALAAAGIAGIHALFSSFGGPTSGGGGGTAGMPRTNVQRQTPSARQESEIAQVEFTIHGDNLKGVLNSQNKKDERRKG